MVCCGVVLLNCPALFLPLRCTRRTPGSVYNQHSNPIGLSFSKIKKRKRHRHPVEPKRIDFHSWHIQKPARWDHPAAPSITGASATPLADRGEAH